MKVLFKGGDTIHGVTHVYEVIESENPFYIGRTIVYQNCNKKIAIYWASLTNTNKHIEVCSSLKEFQESWAIKKFEILKDKP